MSDFHNDDTRKAAAAIIVPKRRALATEFEELLERRSVLLNRIRDIAQEFEDCRAAARLFEIESWIPPHDPFDRNVELVIRNNHAATLRHAQTASDRNTKWEEEESESTTDSEIPEIQTPVASVEISMMPRPPLREILLEQLKLVGDEGSKAAPLREYFERTYHLVIHEKTVGMTLYRLSQDNLVHRNGHTWFFGPEQSETENPGAVTPGPDNRAS